MTELIMFVRAQQSPNLEQGYNIIEYKNKYVLTVKII